MLEADMIPAYAFYGSNTLHFIKCKNWDKKSNSDISFIS